MANPDSYQFYQWFPARFRADRRIRKLDGIDIAILRALHDVLWAMPDKQIHEDDIAIATELDITTEQWRAAKHHTIDSGAIYRDNGFIRSPHVDEAWEHCLQNSTKKAAAANKRWKTNT